MGEDLKISVDQGAIDHLKRYLEIEKTVQAVGIKAKEEDERAAFLNFSKLEQIEAVFEMAKILFAKGDNRVVCELHKPYRSMGYVSVEGKNIALKKSLWLARLGRIANNFEIYPLTNGKVKMTFTFHGLTTPVKEGGANEVL